MGRVTGVYTIVSGMVGLCVFLSTDLPAYVFPISGVRVESSLPFPTLPVINCSTSFNQLHIIFCFCFCLNIRIVCLVALRQKRVFGACFGTGDWCVYVCVGDGGLVCLSVYLSTCLCLSNFVCLVLKILC